MLKVAVFIVTRSAFAKATADMRVLGRRLKMIRSKFVSELRKSHGLQHDSAKRAVERKRLGASLFASSCFGPVHERDAELIDAIYCAMRSASED